MIAIPTTVKIRRFLRNDLNAVLEIQNVCKPVTVWAPQDYKRIASDPRGMILVAEPEEQMPVKLLGYSVFYHLGDEAELWSIAVAPRFRRQGIAKSFLQEACRRLSDTGAEKLFLEVRGSNTPALELYHSLGFTLVARRKDYYSNPREDALVMVNKLIPADQERNV